MVLASFLRDGHPSTMGATFTCRCRVKGSQVYSPSPTSPQMVLNGKAHPLTLVEKTDSQEQLCSKAAPGISLRQGLCSRNPWAWISPFPFHLHLTSFSREFCLNETLMQKSASQVCFWGAQPKTPVFMNGL